jgi:multiple sugar transport system substrate-binding protein
MRQVKSFTRNLFFTILLNLLVILILIPSIVTSAEQIEISMSVWGMPWENKLYTDILIPEFERANPGIKVKFHHFENYFDKILTLYAGGELPDVIRIHTTPFPLWVQKGVLIPLNNYIQAEKFDLKDFHPTTIKSATYDNKIYALPQDMNFRGVLYNKSLFKEAGVPFPKAGWKWKDLEENAKKLTKREGHRISQYGLVAWWNASDFKVLFGKAGGRYWSKDKTKSLINSKAGVNVLSFLRNLVVEYNLAPTVADMGGLGADKFFEMGKAAMLIDGMWRPPAVSQNAPNLDFGVVPFPDGESSLYYVNHGCYFGVTSQSKHPEAAWKLTKFLTNTNSLLIYWRRTWVGPPARFSTLRSRDFKNLTGIPGVVPGLSSEQYKERVQWVIDVMHEKAGKTSVEFMHPYMAYAEGRINSAMEKVLINKEDPKKALDVAVSEINTYLKEQIK